MPNRLRRLSGKDVVAILESFGFVVVRIRGSHHMLRHETHGQFGTISVPVHAHRPLAPGTLKNIYRQTLEVIPDEELRPHFYTD